MTKPKNPTFASEAQRRWAGAQLPPLPNADAHARARDRIVHMTPAEQRETLVSAGIYTASGKLTKHYRP